jgi:putative GTP pyrophosphokinase
MEPITLRERYDKQVPLYEKLATEVTYILKTELEQSNISIHSIIARIKSFGSLSEKALRKGLTDPLSAVTDICGVRIICLFTDDLIPIRDMIFRTFKVRTADEKISTNQAEVFGYVSNHYIVEIPESYAGPRYQGVHGLACEIQVRTITMDCWATISHYLAYKVENEMPSELRRNLSALSALFYLADDRFQAIAMATRAHRQELRRRVKQGKELEAMNLDLDTFIVFLESYFPNALRSNDASYAHLLEELRGWGVTTIEQLRAALDEGQSVLRATRAKYPELYGDRSDHDEGMTRFCARYVYDRQAHNHYMRYIGREAAAARRGFR